MAPLTMTERKKLRDLVAMWEKHADIAAANYARSVLVEDDRLQNENLTEFRVFDAGARALRIALGDE